MPAGGRGIFLWLLLLVVPLGAHAGAWPQAPGATQVIASYEPGQSSQAFDASGHTSSLSGWRQSDAMLFIDHGISPHFTVTAKLDLQDYKTPVSHFSGVGALAIGGRWTVTRGPTSVFAVGASVIGGEGRHNDFDRRNGGTDYEVRAYAGRSFQLSGNPAFIDLQAARYLRQDEASQWRFDATLGVHTLSRWMVLAQAFGGQTDREAWGRSSWVNSQLSVVRGMGPKQDVSLQLGVRETTSGHNVPMTRVLVVGLWKTF